MSTELVDVGPIPHCWTRRHLLGLEALSAEEITAILDKAEVFKQATAQEGRRIPLLAGKTCVNLFFENSTRTRTSFALAARRLGADSVDFSAATSSLSKGETVIDTAKNIEAMGVDAVIIRHRTPGTPHLLSQNLRCSGPGIHPRWQVGSVGVAAGMPRDWQSEHFVPGFLTRLPPPTVVECTDSQRMLLWHYRFSCSTKILKRRVQDHASPATEK